MDSQTLAAVVGLCSKLDSDTLRWLFAFLVGTPFGVLAVVILLYWWNDRRYQDLLRQYREDIDRVSRYYSDNVELVRNWEKIAVSLQDQVVLNTQTMQRMVDVCITNQFCPNARLPK